MSVLEGFAGEPLSNAEVLLRDGDWTIEKMGPAINAHTVTRGSKRSRFYSLLKHVCYPDRKDEKSRLPVNSVHQVVVYADDSDHCWRCTEPIPDGMVAVWKFQNWKELEYGG